jgi:hypothetical protein
LTPGANQVHIAIVARFMSRPGEIRWAALSFGRHNEQTARLLPLLMRRLRAPSPQLPLVLPETFQEQLMTEKQLRKLVKAIVKGKEKLLEQDGNIWPVKVA